MIKSLTTKNAKHKINVQNADDESFATTGDEVFWNTVVTYYTLTYCLKYFMVRRVKHFGRINLSIFSLIKKKFRVFRKVIL